MKAHVEAYGCTLNHGESREIEDLLSSRGWEISDEADGCDLVVIATCVVIDTTERAMLKRLAELRDSPKLIVTGCMATACRDKAEAAAPRAILVPPGDIDAVSSIVGETVGAEPRRSSSDRHACGIVPIATGCLGDCAYCITKLARGELASRQLSEIVASVRRLVVSGPREIQLTAQDTAAYGKDIGTDLSSLVRDVCSVQGDFRLRIGMMTPRSALPMLEQTVSMYGQQKVFKFLHLPVQSASDRLLGRMQRGYVLADFKRIVEVVRDAVPELTLSTDLIVGYPSEGEEDHEANLDLIREMRPDIVNVTRFSPRPGTIAAEQDGQVVGWKAKRRSREITELRFRVALERNRLWLGRRVRALATERGKPGTTILRTDEYKQAVVAEDLGLGRYYEIDITEATPTYLRAKRAGHG
ncbi:MAG: tRNA (N(6)-L-threonylcarbamoyladenosine(37)-C(2))-methylthiotransferase [Candidatus Thermoplasmatota archaeon]|nr:tRNA (N(6)-L-threonylcarbamoyladenosine(37)-C(2))-methylthiotransferase [Candidatus Thermoplasmatota archaeon]